MSVFLERFLTLLPLIFHIKVFLENQMDDPNGMKDKITHPAITIMSPSTHKV